MSEALVEEKTEAKRTDLVSVTFRNGKNEEVTRDVYPEVAKFVTTRAEALRSWNQQQRDYQRDRQRHIWEQEDAYWAENSGPNAWFDENRAGRDYDRNDDHRDQRREAERRYYDFVNGSARTAAGRNRATNPNSWAILREEAEAAGHKTPVWIVDNCMDSEHEAFQIMQYLPATVEELWQIAKDDHEMCGVFDRYMERAEAAGLFKEGDVPVALREIRALQSYIRRTYGSSYTRDLMNRINPIIKIEREAAIADATSEWDKELLNHLREVRGSDGTVEGVLRALAENHPTIQTYLNRSDAAKAAHARRQGHADDVEQPVGATVISTQSAMTGEIIRSQSDPFDYDQPRP